MEAIRERGVTEEVTPEQYELMKAEAASTRWYQSSDAHDFGNGKKQDNPNHSFTPPGGRNKRSVWSIPSEPYPGSHFATFPTALVEPCLLAGTSEGGCCSICGKPLKRLVEEKKLTRERPNEYVKRTGEPGTGNTCSNTVAGVETVTVGWEFACECESSENLQEIVPCAILDPFVGSGTVCQVALEHGRNSVGIDLSEQYLRENAVKRIEGTLFSVPALRHLVPRAETSIKIVGKVVKPV